MRNKIFKENGPYIFKGKAAPTPKELKNSFDDLSARRAKELTAKKRRESTEGQYDDLLPKNSNGEPTYYIPSQPPEVGSKSSVKRANTPAPKKPEIDINAVKAKAAWDKRIYDREMAKKPPTQEEIKAQKNRDLGKEWESDSKGASSGAPELKSRTVADNQRNAIIAQKQAAAKSAEAQQQAIKAEKTKAFNTRLDAYKSTANTPNRVVDDIKRKFDEVKTNYNTNAGGFADKVKNVGTGLAIGAGVIGAGVAVANVLKKRKWKTEGCRNIEDPAKREKCKQYLYNSASTDAKRECRYSNDPRKCHEMVLDRIKRLV